MYKKYDVVIVGGGIFGCLIALELSDLGRKVIILEKNSDLMVGATLNNQNRLHLGYHYPRDLNTALQCKKGFKNFINDYPECIVSGIDNFYLLSQINSKVSPDEYELFCQKAGLAFEKYDINELPEKIYNTNLVINTNEVLYDCKILAEVIKGKLIKKNIDYLLNAKVSEIKNLDNIFRTYFNKDEIDSSSIVNCTYSNLNSFHSNFNLKPSNFQYELTLVPIIRWRENKPLLGITIMDGPFFSILPFGKSGLYLLYHVDDSVFKRHIGTNPPEMWNQPKEVVTKEIAFEKYKLMTEKISNWLPNIKSSVFIDYLSTVRMVFKNVEDTDERPSIVSKMPLNKPFYNVFSGKIDHSIWVSKDLAKDLSKQLS